jgi:hypothetical protein
VSSTMRRWAVSVMLIGLTPTSARAETADELLQKGVARFALADFEGSLRWLGQAEAATREPMLLAQIVLYTGINHAVLGDTAKARQAFRRALTHDPRLMLERRRFKQEIVDLFGEVRAGLRGALEVTSDLGGAVVFVNGQRAGAAPHRASFAIGELRVEVRSADGSLRQERRVVVGPDQTVRLAVSFEPPRARVHVTSTPSGAELSIDGQTRGRTPWEGKLEPGTHQLALRLGGEEKLLTLSVAAKEDRRVQVDLARAVAPRRRLWTWVTGGAAVATLAVAVGLAVAANADHDEWQSELARGKDRQRWEDLSSSGQAKALSANILFGVGGALAVTSVVLFFVEGRSPGKEARVTTRLTPLVGGAALTTTF